MPGSGRRVGFGERGRERAWWLLAAAVPCAAWAAVAGALKWSGWAIGVPVVVAVAAALVVPELRARFKVEDERTALLRATVTVPGGPGRLPLVRDVGLAQLRVHAAQVPASYIERDAQQQVAEAVDPGRAVLLVGHSMAGKTRLAAHVVQHRFPDAPLLVPKSGKALRDLMDKGLAPAGVVVWLDDLERFLGPDGLMMDLLNGLTSGNAIVVATIRSDERERYRPRNELRPPEWEVFAGFTQIDLQRRNSAAELDRIRAAVSDPHVLDAVQHYGLAEYLGAGPLAVDKFKHGETTEPVGYALIRAALDWRRSGLSHPIPKPVLATPAVVSIYLADRPEEPRTQEALVRGLKWATEEINETVALLGRRFPDPIDTTVEAFEAFDYLVDHVTDARTSIPEQLWQLSLQEAQPTEWMDVGYAAYESINVPVAEHAFRKAAVAGDSGAMFNLGVLLKQAGELGEAETWYRRAAEAGHGDAMYNLGGLLVQRGERGEAETWYRRAAKAGHSGAIVVLGVLLKQAGDLGEAETWWRRAAEAGDSRAMTNLGVLLKQAGELGEAETWWRRAAEAGQSRAMTNLGLLLVQRGERGEAETWYRRAAEAGHGDAMINLAALRQRQEDSTETETE
jgi:Flp pilus assembly protein TadD